MNWILYLFVFLAAGTLSWRRILPNRPSIENLLLGALWGLVLSSFLPFLLSLIFSFANAVFISQLIAIFFFAVLIIVDRYFWLSEANRLKRFFLTWNFNKKIFLIFFLVLSILYLILVSKVLFISNGWYTTGFVTAYGDVPFHLMYISSFAFGDNFPPQNPDYAGVSSDYPFLPYFSSAALINLGSGLLMGFMAPIFLLSLLIIALLIYVPWKIIRDVWTAVLVPFIFLCSGGLGFLWFFQAHGLDIFSSQAKFAGSFLDTATSISGSGINFMNVVLCALLPQRGILFGIPIFLVTILLWFRGDRRSIIASALFVGISPLLSAHTFIALILIISIRLPILFFQKLREKFKFDYVSWIIFFAIIFLAVLPVLAFFRPNIGNSSAKFIRFTTGWMVNGENFIWYWIKNLGFFLPALVMALFWKRIPFNFRLWYLPFLSIFIIPNFVLFSPWEFDNHKFFHLWYLVSSFMVSYLIVTLFKNKNILLKFSAGLLLLLIVLSGGIDIIRTWHFSKNGFELFSPEAQKTAEFIKLNVPPSETILASTSHLSPLIISGRKRLVGYTGWLWAHGIDYSQRASDIKNIFAGAPNALELLVKYNIKYVLVGEQEKSEFSVNIRFFDDNFLKVYDQNGYQVFLKTNSQTSPE